MMESNEAMRRLLVDSVFSVPLNPALRSVVDSGFVASEDCHFLAALLPATKSVTRSKFQDCTGYECFVNSVHVEDYDARAPLCQALQFVMEIFVAWRAATRNLILTSIISTDEFSVVVKFHVKRPAEKWLSDNMEGYDDPIMSADSSEDLITVLQSL